MTWLPEILFAICPIMKAIADTTDDHYNISIFQWMNKKFWEKDTSSLYAKRLFGYKFDAYHISYSILIVCVCAAISLHQNKLAWYYEFAIAGIYWNLCFNIFYNKILLK